MLESDDDLPIEGCAHEGNCIIDPDWEEEQIRIAQEGNAKR